MNALHPLFTQKHYEFLEEAIRKDAASPESKKHAVAILCRVFAKDNPKFKHDLFWNTATGETK
jgi:hypothetical protein